MVDTNDALLREVNDAVRHDQMMAMWRQYRKPLLAAAIGLIVATAGAGIWRDYKETQAGRAMQQLQKAQVLYVQQSYDASAAEFKTAADIAMDADARDMATLWQGRALEKAGKKDEAVNIFESLATKPAGNDGIWRDLACLRLVSLDATKTKCLGAGNSPLVAQRKLLQAANLWKMGKTAEAAVILKALSQDANAPQALRDQAQQYLTVVATHETE